MFHLPITQPHGEAGRNEDSTNKPLVLSEQPLKVCPERLYGRCQLTARRPNQPEGYVTCLIGSHMNQTDPLVCKRNLVAVWHECNAHPLRNAVYLTLPGGDVLYVAG